MQKQKLLRIQLPKDGARLYPAQFRRALADSESLPAAFFHYQENGHPIPTGPAPLRVVGGRSWVGLLAHGSEGEELMNLGISVAIDVVSRHYDRALPVTIEQVEQGFETLSYSMTYNLRDMVIKRRSARRKAQTAEVMVKEVIISGLLKSGLDIPPDDQLDMRFHELDSKGIVIAKVNDKPEYGSLLNGIFSMHANLSGYWQVGHLQSRGYGWIYPRISGRRAQA